jgi:hypothetical protein
VRMLSFHRAYACRHSGACCSAGWIEPRADGVCRHFDAHPSGGCTVQRVHGHDALPHACQQFPRVATLSPLGTSVTLSAFCPTAAALLFDDAPFTIDTLVDSRVYEGLDARAVMPPLLRPGMLMDWDSVARWEELAVATLSDHRHDAARALGIIADASLQVSETWTPGSVSLREALETHFRTEAAEPTEPEEPMEPSAARFFASHAFACWPMYDGRGMRGALDWLVKARTALDEERRSHDLLEAFRQSDLRLRHAVTFPP